MGKHRTDLPVDKEQPSPPLAKFTLAAFLGLGLGFFVFNCGSLLTHTHIALSLSHQHKMMAFRDFVGLPEHGGTGEALTQSRTTPSAQKAVGSITNSMVHPDAPKQLTTAPSPVQQLQKHNEQQQEHDHQLQQVQTQDKTVIISDTLDIHSSTNQPAKSVSALTGKELAEATAILSTRVCGSPAVDGYAHVVPKCLEESPTNNWWRQYYKAGGKQQDLVVHIERAADYDGLAVKWGLNNKVKSEVECAQQCLNHMPNTIGGPYENLPCNAFAFCPDDVCFEPDAHHHTKGDCWLKFSEGPAWIEVNMRGILPADYKARHAEAPDRVQWISGVLLPKGVKPTNGTWGPRWKW